jgi:EAL domain-containing protein (putative c-di-GMP-specific phosphodiesterase class I)
MEVTEMPENATASAATVWFLVGPLNTAEVTRYVPVYIVPFVVGRRQNVSLALSSKTVSGLHAEITESDGALLLRDLDSTNGTYVNGQRITGLVELHADDLVQFANVAFRVLYQAAPQDTRTVPEDVCDRAMALVQFDKLMAERAATPYFQPIVAIPTRKVLAYEVLGRSRLFGLETPKDMFRVAAQLNLEVELSTMLRWEGIQASRGLAESPHLFMNTHPRELSEPGLLGSLQALRASHPDQRLTLEIHESAVTDPARMTELRSALKALSIDLAYDDFGAGQSRLNELVESPPDYLKFDMSLIRDINTASSQRQQVLVTLVQMARDLGIAAVAEGIETLGESETCRQMGFDLGQGYFYGRPAPAKKLQFPT